MVIGALSVIVCDHHWPLLMKLFMVQVFITGNESRDDCVLFKIVSHTNFYPWLLHLPLLLRGFWRIPAYFCRFMPQLMLLAITIPY